MNWLQSYCSIRLPFGHEVEGVTVTFMLLPEDAFPCVLIMNLNEPGSGTGKMSHGKPLSMKGRILQY